VVVFLHCEEDALGAVVSLFEVCGCFFGVGGLVFHALVFLLIYEKDLATFSLFLFGQVVCVCTSLRPP